MLRKILLLLCLVNSFSVSAQTIQEGFVRPPDVPAYVATFEGYASGTNAAIIGDGSDARGGSMPALAIQLPDIPSTAPGWVLTGSPGFVTVTDPAHEEAKARFHANYSHINFNDAIRLWGQKGASHCHEYFGATETNAFSTYASLRNRANYNAAHRKVASTAGGGPYLAGGYWTPCVTIANPFGDGKNYVLPAATDTLYYVCPFAENCTHAQRIPRGFRTVGGVNMDDPYDTIFKAQIAAANAQPGTAGRYTYPGNGFVGWSCWTNVGGNSSGANIPYTVEGGGVDYPALKTAAGADPWGGTCEGDMLLVARFVGPACYDGTNLWAPGGYKNMRQALIDNVSSANTEGCPEHSFRLIQLVINKAFNTTGWADFSRWYLSSDASATAKAQSIDGAAPPMRAAESFHFDYIPAWDDATFVRWMDFCHKVITSGTMHVCDPDTLDATHYLNAANAPDMSRRPQVSTTDSHYSSNRTQMVQVPASLSGAHVIQVH